MEQGARVLAAVLLFVIIIHYGFDSQVPPAQGADRKVDFPHVPRISPQEAAMKFRTGMVMLISADSPGTFKKRRIVGAMNYCAEDLRKGRIKLPSFPKAGIEIVTYCYWTQESAAAGLADYLIQNRGHRNVKTVDEGGRALERVLPHYSKTHYGGKITDPLTGKVIEIKEPWHNAICYGPLRAHNGGVHYLLLIGNEHSYSATYAGEKAFW